MASSTALTDAQLSMSLTGSYNAAKSTVIDCHCTLLGGYFLWYTRGTFTQYAGVKLSQVMSKKDELSVIYGRVLTVLEAIGALPEGCDDVVYTSTTSGIISYPENNKRNAIKSLISDAIFTEIRWGKENHPKGIGVIEKGV